MVWPPSSPQQPAESESPPEPLMTPPSSQDTSAYSSHSTITPLPSPNDQLVQSSAASSLPRVIPATQLSSQAYTLLPASASPTSSQNIPSAQPVEYDFPPSPIILSPPSTFQSRPPSPSQAYSSNLGSSPPSFIPEYSSLYPQQDQSQGSVSDDLDDITQSFGQIQLDLDNAGRWRIKKSHTRERDGWVV
ncbi:hypothetical protein B0I35DRAFT_235625 [Stachybotrys elegans]|uniref:Uncharacterized protein n=1 Tax=Stachybotrys elegans TaxID=80388 RepID=A0A8K0WQ95_9HYPO|nr:hypothetical protein B0I35DRAFT_235625 [Stachybotrys elegans]